MNPAYLHSLTKPSREDVRRRIVEAKKANPELNAERLASRFGVSQSAVLRALRKTK